MYLLTLQINLYFLRKPLLRRGHIYGEIVHIKLHTVRLYTHEKNEYCHFYACVYSFTVCNWMCTISPYAVYLWLSLSPFHLILEVSGDFRRKKGFTCILFSTSSKRWIAQGTPLASWLAGGAKSCQ